MAIVLTSVPARGYQMPFFDDPTGGFSPTYVPPDGVAQTSLLSCSCLVTLS